MKLRSLLLFVFALLAAIGAAQSKPSAARSQSLSRLDVRTMVSHPPVDTRRFFPQVVDTFREVEEEVENVFHFPHWSDPVAVNKLPVGGVLPKPRIPVGSMFPTVGYTGWVPPDPTAAVSPSHVVVTVNNTIAFYSRSGTLGFQQDIHTFLGITLDNTLFDPRVVYDQTSGRFIMVIVRRVSPGTSTAYFAVSDDSDPNGSWTVSSLNTLMTVSTTKYWLDYPMLGYNKDAVVLTGNWFGFSSGFGGTGIWIIPKASLLSGTPTASTFRDFDAFAVQMAEINDNVTTSVFGMCNYNSANVKAFAINDVTGVPTLQTWFISVPNFTYPSEYATSSGGKIHDPSDGRHLQAVWRNGHLLTAATVRTSSVTTNIVRWYEFDFSSSPASTPTLYQSGNVAGPTGTHYFMPAVNKNSQGDVSLLFTRSSSSIVADIMCAARYSTDPAGTMGTPVLLKSADGSPYLDGGRWGDYQKVVIDPIDDTTFWGVGMTAGSDGHWKTHVYNWTVSRLSGISVTPGSVRAGTSAQVTVSLGQAAGPDGATVTLASSSPSLVSVPTSVMIPSGQSQATFAVATGAVSSDTSVDLSATLGAATQTTTLFVLPNRLASASLNPGSVTGGVSPGPSLVVTLQGPAPAGGQSVSVSSSDPSVATCASSVVVPAGSSQLSVPINTTPGATTRYATFTASLNGSSASIRLRVYPPLPSSVSVSPTAVQGGTATPVTGTVTLTGPAPAGGMVVTLSSANTAVFTVPANVTVPEGSTTATFPIAHYAVASKISPAVSATIATTTRSALLSVTPPTLYGVGLSVTTVTGGSGTVVTGTVTLTGPAPAAGMPVNLSSSNPAVATVPATMTVPGGATSGTFTVTHYPTATQKSSSIGALLGTVGRTKLLTVIPPALYGVTATPGAITGGSGQTATGSVVLTGPAPTGGIVVALAKDLPQLSLSAASVTVPAGSTSANFTIGAVTVPDRTTGTISATLGSVTRTRSFTIYPPTLTSLVLSPNTVVGGSGTTVTGTVTISLPAPTGGIVVNLTTNSAAATPPLNVVIPAGATSATFSVTHRLVQTQVLATIVASTSFNSKSARLTINP